MSSASQLATNLDEEMLLSRGISIASSTTPDSMLPSKSGRAVAAELGGRLLLRYLQASQVGLYTKGSSRRHWVTPTPYAPDDTVRYLALPDPTQKREFVLWLMPEKIEEILGPRWIRGGVGIEYVLPKGFPLNSLVFTWEVQVG